MFKCSVGFRSPVLEGRFRGSVNALDGRGSHNLPRGGGFKAFQGSRGRRLGDDKSRSFGRGGSQVDKLRDEKRLAPNDNAVIVRSFIALFRFLAFALGHGEQVVALH